MDVEFKSATYVPESTTKVVWNLFDSVDEMAKQNCQLDSAAMAKSKAKVDLNFNTFIWSLITAEETLEKKRKSFVKLYGTCQNDDSLASKGRQGARSAKC